MSKEVGYGRNNIDHIIVKDRRLKDLKIRNQERKEGKCQVLACHESCHGILGTARPDAGDQFLESGYGAVLAGGVISFADILPLRTSTEFFRNQSLVILYILFVWSRISITSPLTESENASKQ